MGTNYYLHRNICPHCGHADDPLHIGKSSGGWCFSLHVYPEQGILDLPDWRKIFENGTGVIRNEYGNDVTIAEMMATIGERSCKERYTPFGYASWEHFHRENQSSPGPCGLVRHRLDGQHCIGHGTGTWDLIVGEFS